MRHAVEVTLFIQSKSENVHVARCAAAREHCQLFEEAQKLLGDRLDSRHMA